MTNEEVINLYIRTKIRGVVRAGRLMVATCARMVERMLKTRRNDTRRREILRR